MGWHVAIEDERRPLHSKHPNSVFLIGPFKLELMGHRLTGFSIQVEAMRTHRVGRAEIGRGTICAQYTTIDYVCLGNLLRDRSKLARR